MHNDLRKMYYIAILGCIVSGILLLFNTIIGIMYYHYYM